jgi:methionine-rich copper-binding protein CopC
VKRRALLRLALVAAALPAAARAHAVLVRTSPPHRAVLRQAPRQVELWFNERLEPAFSTLTVSTKAGAAVSTGPASVSGQDAKRLSLALPSLAEGEYLVRFRVLSVDGHIAEGSFSFAVGKP